ncbi:hypothetical protein [uncultured Kordia sp.]|uniref:hypothetical protein n=1 Tax=uncultured Kordia sp. TaxID=507699 RepID=UPI0026282ED2|nr:hypothetical protein [uncultured Kordia sp.]
MIKHTIRLFFMISLFPLLLLGQKTKNTDSKKNTKAVITPMVQKDKELYHYSKVTTLPFENNCAPELNEKERMACAESHVRTMIFENLNMFNDFSGNVYVYFTVTKEGKITDIATANYPKTYDYSDDFRDAIMKLKVKPGMVDGKAVHTRMWTPFTFPTSSKELLSESFAKMKDDKDASYEKYELLLFDATQYIFALPVFEKGRECNAAFNIVRFWMNKETETAIPLGGKFYESLTSNQKFLYVAAVLKYQLEQKHYEGRLVSCNPKREGLSKEELRKEIKEVQLEAAKIMLTYMSDEKNNVPMKSKTKKFYRAMKKGKLKEKLFD